MSALAKPVDYYTFWLSRDAGRAFYHTLFRWLPTMLLGVLLFGVRLPADVGRWGCFFLSVALALLLAADLLREERGELTMGHERAHRQLLGEGEGLTLVAFGLLGVWARATQYLLGGCARGMVGRWYWGFSLSRYIASQEFIDGLTLGLLAPGPVLVVTAYIGYKV